MASFSDWLVTFRLRTLPLSLSTIIMGSFLAAYHEKFHWSIFILAVLTTLFLQTLSNLANDYGDTQHGVDNHKRTGPKRSLQAGTISLKQMKTAIIVCIILSLMSGISLILVSLRGMVFSYGILLLILGLLAIAAALKYTMGKKPYGYVGLGDVSVFIFFGVVGVLGTLFLHTHELFVFELLPATAMGLFSTGVLNLNNLRDRENDAVSGKNTLIVKVGHRKGKIYHAVLVFGGILSALLYSLINPGSWWHWLYVLSFPFFIRSIIVVFKNKNPSALDPELRALALTTLGFSILFGLGLIV